MTRKHFEAIAKVLKRNEADPNLIAEIAGVLADSNPRFDEKRFIKACIKGV